MDKHLRWALRKTALAVSVGALIFAAVLLIADWAGRSGARSVSGGPATASAAAPVSVPAGQSALSAPADFICREIFSPLDDPDRLSFASLRRRVSGLYGEYRKSYVPGHLHAGIDINGPFKDRVYAVGKGRVHLVFREFPHLSVAVEHTLPDGSVLYSMYVHVMDVKVAVGDEVDETTVLARLFDAEELAKADFGTANHLHFEIRFSLDDGGRASASSMTPEALNLYCRDPLSFFMRHLR
jgi:murein DD-endopeptidase MepM/ murein hydrolase activator NlpD